MVRNDFYCQPFAYHHSWYRQVNGGIRHVSVCDWHPQQKGKPGADGSYQLELPYSDDCELLMGILRLGTEVEVNASAQMRKRIQQELKAVLVRHSRDPEDGQNLGSTCMKPGIVNEHGIKPKEMQWRTFS